MDRKYRQMKNSKEIIARAIILLCVSDRCALEEEIISGQVYSKNQREKQRSSIYNWLVNKGYIKYMTKSEINFFERIIGTVDKCEVLDMQMQYEAIEPCLWTLGLIEELSNYDQFVITDFHPILKIGMNHTIEKILETCNLRTKDEIFLQTEISMLWNWRIIEWNNLIFEKQNIKDIINSTFGPQYKNISEKIQQISDNQSDFIVNNKLFKNINLQEKNKVECIARYRYHSFAWISGNDLWDETELNS